MPLAPLSRLVNVTVVETEPPEFTSTRLLHKEHCILQGKKNCKWKHTNQKAKTIYLHKVVIYIASYYRQ